MALFVVFFLLGVVLVLKGADWLTDGASSIARKLKVSTMVIGLTVVAFGTSCPELVVSSIASLQGSSEMAIGNVVGSNIFNTLAILGFTSLISPIVCKRNTMVFDMPINIVATIVLIWFIMAESLGGTSINRWEGLILLLCFAGFMAYTFQVAKADRKTAADEPQQEPLTLTRPILFVVIGLAGLIIGGELLVKGASGIASGLGVSESVIALTIVAAGTSFPELATSVVAAKKGDTDMAIGNVVGSNIFNILFILGVASIINPLDIGAITTIDFAVLMASSVLMLYFCFEGRQKRLNRKEGAFLIVCMTAYYVWLVYNA